MDFKFSEEDEKFRHEFRSWLEQNIPRDWRGDSELDADDKSEFERRREWHRKLYDAGWMCIHWPKGVWRTRRHSSSAAHLQPGTRTRQSAAGGQLPGHRASQVRP